MTTTMVHVRVKEEVKEKAERALGVRPRIHLQFY